MVHTPQWLRGRWPKVRPWLIPVIFVFGFVAVLLRWLFNWWRNRPVWTVPAILVLFFFAVLGAFTGWYVGESRVPVVGIFIPIIAGLMGGVSVALFDRKATTEKVLKAVQELTVQNPALLGTSSQLESKLSEPSWWVLVFWLFNVVVFCLSSFFGFHNGIDFRVPKYRPVTELTELSQNHNATPEEMGVLQELTWHLQSNHVPAEEVESLFKHTINPILAKKGIKPDCRLSSLTWTVDRILKIERSPSSVPCSMQPKSSPEPPTPIPGPELPLPAHAAGVVGLAITPIGPNPLSAIGVILNRRDLVPPGGFDLTRAP